MGKYSYVTDDVALKKVVRTLAGAEALAVDLEADSMYHHREKVCLIQMAQNDHHWVIDPLKINDLTPLLPMFADESVEKIFHGADYDIRSLYRDFEIEINNLFDTELASRFLGVAQTGLASVLADRFNVHMDKKFQKKDWSRRPLPDEMIDYAMGDVTHLVTLANILKTELKAAGRYEWVKEECRLLSRVRPPDPDQRPLFIRFSGAGRLDRRSLAVLEAVLVVRDRFARKKDRPVFKIMSSHSILRIATEKPTSKTRLKQSRILSDKQIAMYATEILAAVKSAMAQPMEALPSYPRNRKPVADSNLARRIKALKAWREKSSKNRDLPAGTLINNNQITTIAALNPADKAGLMAMDGIRSWQVDAFGDDLLNVLDELPITGKHRTVNKG
ncbi:MAG: HRDC domain-containing protein [Thermodesulfobacteriota bacterium]|nr:HRDC domain-containing protein [Thermodesulfobacteriota bacterium]